jgi:hypothetical protein
MLRRILAAASVATIASVVSLGTGNSGSAAPISVPMTVTGIQTSGIPAAYVVKKKIIIKKKRGVVSRTVVVKKHGVTRTRVVVKKHGVTTRASVSVKKHGTTRTKIWVYSSHRHGARYRHKHGTFVYYYGGYYYARPWWRICIGCS